MTEALIMHCLSILTGYLYEKAGPFAHQALSYSEQDIL